MNRRNKYHTITRCTIILIALLLGIAAVYAQNVAPQQPAVDEKTQTAIIDSVTAALNDAYVFPDVAKKMEQLVRNNLKEGKYKKIKLLSEFTDQLTSDLQSVSHDKHLLFQMPRSQDQNGAPAMTPDEERKRQLEQLRRDNYGFRKVEILPGNIGYLDFRYFAETSFGEAAATAIAAMNFLAHTDAIIFDMRQNGGGNPSMIQLISSYLFEEPVHLNTFYIRKTDETQQFWTQGHVVGPKMTAVPVYVLTSSATFSGAEEFTYNLKNLKRGTIIGEVTGGGAHPVNIQDFPTLHISLQLPYGRAINPITKTNWEGTGVTPDINVPADQALTVARIEALKKIMDKEQNPTRKKQLAWALKSLDLEKNPVTLDAKTLASFEGSFGPRRIFLENSSLYYQRESRPKFRLVPMGDDTFQLVGLDNFRIRFNRGTGGEVTELVGMYDDGRTDVNPRSNR
jgi:hypothetical protein